MTGVEAARVLLKEVLPVGAGQTLLITADDQSDHAAAYTVAEVAESLGATATVYDYPMVPAMSEPPAVVAIAATHADHWINLSVGYHLYSEAYDAAIGSGTAYLELTGMDIDMMIRTIGQVDNSALTQMRDSLYASSQAADRLRLTSAAGTELVMVIDKAGDPFWEPPEAGVQTGQMLGGQSGCMVIRESVNGTMVFDGAVWPPDSLGLLRHPVAVDVVDGYLVRFAGSDEAVIYEKWLREAGHRDAMMFDHLCYGFNPGVTEPTGKILEDERVFGCVQIGVGAPEYGSPVHSDGVILRPSVWLDDTPLMDNGTFVGPGVARLASSLLR